MFYRITLKDYIKLEPKYMKEKVLEHLKEELENLYEGLIDKKIGIIVAVLGIKEVKQSVFVPEDGYFYFETIFDVLVYRPEVNELTYGIVSSTTTFGVFINIGVIDALVHLSQIGDKKFVFQDNKLVSEDGKEVIKKGDKVKGRIIAVSYKEEIPKVALTLRQPTLGKIE
ncbi:MAG: DNA-directed RNA polymerase [Nanoarchaeota archaeon]